MRERLGVPQYSVGLWLLPPPVMRCTNARFAGKADFTDVLSFPFYDQSELPEPGRLPKPRPEELGSLDLGDIFVCPRFIREQAGRDPVLLRQFLCAAVAHGLCHLLGYTHDTSDNAKQVRSTPLFS